MKQDTLVKVGDKTLKLSHLDKVYYPEIGFTKGQVLDYYSRIASVILPHVKNRPLTLKRYPNGVEGEFFYEKRCPSHKPDWVKMMPTKKEDDVNYCVIDSKATLLWTVNLASIELHVLLSKSNNPACPTMIMFDLDPDPKLTLLDPIWAALKLKILFDTLKLKSFPKTSGGKGIHVAVPLNDLKMTYERTKPFAQKLAQLLESKFPDRITSQMKKSLRTGKIFIDWSQNTEHKTTVAAYSLRARKKPYVSTPVTWEELERAAKTKKVSQLFFETNDVLKRVQKLGDLFEPTKHLKQNLPKI